MTRFFRRLYHGRTDIDFIGRRRIGFTVSLVLILVSVLSLFTRGFNLGIDFEGGVSWDFPVGEATVESTEAVMEDAGLRGAQVQTLTSSEGDRIRVKTGPQPIEVQQEVSVALAQEAGVAVDDVSLNSVGPSWGDEVTEKALRALVFFLVAIAIYISLRFEWRMAIAALVAVAHDVVISMGVYSVFQFEVTPATVIAFLTILGYSLYDTIVVFDRVHENTTKVGSSGKVTYSEIVNLSMNGVLARSINTSFTSVVPVLSLLVIGSWIMGAVALESFAIALLVGLLVGSYSSIFVAAPLLAVLKERETRWRQVRERAALRGSGRVRRDEVLAEQALVAEAASDTGEARVEGSAADGADDAEPAPVASAARTGGGDGEAAGPAETVVTRPRAGSTAIPPRPRKKRRR